MEGPGWLSDWSVVGNEPMFCTSASSSSSAYTFRIRGRLAGRRLSCGGMKAARVALDLLSSVCACAEVVGVTSLASFFLLRLAEVSLDELVSRLVLLSEMVGTVGEKTPTMRSKN